ncbi:MAG: hypothetical protein ACTTGU_06025 [Moraxella sp.]
MRKILTLLMMTAAFTTAQTTFAGAAEIGKTKMQCVILNNGKVTKKTPCIATGYVYAGAAYGAGSGWTFQTIKGYGKITVDTSIYILYDANDNIILDKSGEPKYEANTLMNKKDAIMRYRMPTTFKVLTKKQEELYYNGKLKNTKGKTIEPYTCLHQKNKPNFEFCFDAGFPG